MFVGGEGNILYGQTFLGCASHAYDQGLSPPSPPPPPFPVPFHGDALALIVFRRRPRRSASFRSCSPSHGGRTPWVFLPRRRYRSPPRWSRKRRRPCPLVLRDHGLRWDTRDTIYNHRPNLRISRGINTFFFFFCFVIVIAFVYFMSPDCVAGLAGSPVCDLLQSGGRSGFFLGAELKLFCS